MWWLVTLAFVMGGVIGFLAMAVLFWQVGRMAESELMAAANEQARREMARRARHQSIIRDLLTERWYLANALRERGFNAEAIRAMCGPADLVDRIERYQNSVAAPDHTAEN